MRFSLASALLLLLNLSLPAVALDYRPYESSGKAHNTALPDVSSGALVAETFADTLLKAVDSGVDDDGKSSFSRQTLAEVILTSAEVLDAVFTTGHSVGRHSLIRAPPAL